MNHYEKVNKLSETYKKPELLIESKYSKKAIKAKNKINWFFFKKK